MSRIVVDPITRIEGHLRVEATVEDGVITDAWSSGTMVRGFEKHPQGAGPPGRLGLHRARMWRVHHRACPGQCALRRGRAGASRCPPNAELIRNLMFCAQFVQDHVVHFYHLHALDWVDVVSALSADPVETSALAQSISNWPKSSPGLLQRPQEAADRVRGERAARHLRQRLLGPRRPTGCRPAANLMAVAHYLEALEWQKEIVKIHAIFGGKNPHPNYLVGGVPCSINLEEVNAINSERLNHVAAPHQAGPDRSSSSSTSPTCSTVASVLPRSGSSHRRRAQQLPVLWGPPYARATTSPDSFKFPRGAILDRDLSVKCTRSTGKRRRGDQASTSPTPGTATPDGDAAGAAPLEGRDRPQLHRAQSRPTSTWTRRRQVLLDQDAALARPRRWRSVRCRACSWPTQAATEEVTEVIDRGALAALERTALMRCSPRSGARPPAASRRKLVARWMQELLSDDSWTSATSARATSRPSPEERWEPSSWPASAQGVGLDRGAPRRARPLDPHRRTASHRQLPAGGAFSTWNASPRDPKGQKLRV